MAVAIALSIGGLGAQNYQYAVGLRGGYDMSGITGRFVLTSESMLEGLLSSDYDRGLTATALYEYYMPVITDGFNLYFGGGVHAGAWDSLAFGLDAVAGLEYKIPTLPLSASVDYKPSFTFGNNSREGELRMFGLALAIRYTF